MNGRCRYWAVLLAVFAFFTVCAGAALADGKPVGITADLPFVETIHAGKPFRIQRDQDNDAEIDPHYAPTSRPCPPYCVQPMQLAPGVETLGELEMLDHLKRLGRRDSALLVIDSRDQDWLIRTGMIPGAIHLPWTRLHPAHAEPQAVAEILELQFGAARTGPIWNFENAKILVLYCNGAWCGQSPTNIKQLLAIGYPAHKLKWYRGGMQSWTSLGLSTVPYKKP
jgi:rhodanese-related sulfurtransferase